MGIVAIIVVIGIAFVVLEGGSAISGSLSDDDIAGFAAAAGWSGDNLAVAIAIAMAESGGDPNTVGDTDITPGGSIGLWQINLKAHPQYTADQLTDPQANANAAYLIYQAAGNSFSPWSTYNRGQYATFLTDATNAAANEGAYNG